MPIRVRGKEFEVHWHAVAGSPADPSDPLLSYKTTEVAILPDDRATVLEPGSHPLEYSVTGKDPGGHVLLAGEEVPFSPTPGQEWVLQYASPGGLLFESNAPAKGASSTTTKIAP
jgi:hypothetical protein